MGVGPDVLAAAFAEEDADDVLAVIRGAGDEAVAGGFGVAGFHSVAEAEVFEEFVRVIEGGGFAGVVVPLKDFGAHDSAEDAVAVGVEGEARHVVRGAVLVGLGETVRVYEIGATHPEFAGFGVHLFCEVFDAAGVVTGEAAGDVVHAFYEENSEEIVAPVSLSFFEPELGLLALGVWSRDADVGVKVAVFGNDEGRHELLRAGDGAGGGCVFLVEHAARGGVANDDRLRRGAG